MYLTSGRHIHLTLTDLQSKKITVILFLGGAIHSVSTVADNVLLSIWVRKQHKVKWTALNNEPKALVH